MVGVPSFFFFFSPTNTLTLYPKFIFLNNGVNIIPSTADPKKPIIIANIALVNNNISFTPFLLQYYIIVIALLCNFYCFRQNFTFLLYVALFLLFDYYVLIIYFVLVLFFLILLLLLSYHLIIYLNYLIILCTLVIHLYNL